MKQNVSIGMILSLLGLLLMTESCRRFNRPTEIVYQDKETVYQDEECFENIEDCDSETPFFLPEEFESNLCRLFEMQGILLNDAIVAILHHPSEEIVEQGKTNLCENGHEIATLFATIYGSKVGSRIEALISQQNKLFLAYAFAIKFQNDDLAKELFVRSYVNGQMLVEFLNIMNPFFAYEPEKYMMDEHVTLETDQVKAYFKEDLEQAEELKVRSIKQLREMAMHMAKAIHTQIADPMINFSDCCRDWE